MGLKESIVNFWIATNERQITFTVSTFGVQDGMMEAVEGSAEANLLRATGFPLRASNTITGIERRKFPLADWEIDRSTAEILRTITDPNLPT